MPSLDPQDTALLERMRRGEEEAFNKLYEKYWKWVYNQSYKRLRDHGRAENITQEIFLKLWINRKSVSVGNLPAYFYVAVRNKVLNLLDKEKRLIPVDQLFREDVKAEQADKLLLENEFLKAYEMLVQSLPEKRRVIFLQYHQEGKTTAEIAELLSVSRKTVQNQLRRATAFLKAELVQLLILAGVIFWVIPANIV